MPRKHHDLHGSAPDESPVALLLIDVVNDLEFEGSERIVEPAVRMARRLRGLAARAREAGVPVVYVNDNFGRWRSDFRETVEHVRGGTRGAELARLLAPEEDDYFVLKPKHSGFYSTSLDLLLEHLGARLLVLTGIAGDSCVLRTATDAQMRDFDVIVVPDCTVSETEERNRAALAVLERSCAARLVPSEELDFGALARAVRGGAEG